MRTEYLEARRDRALISLLAEALGIVRQDVSEYGFIGLLGAFASSVTVVALRLAGGSIAVAFVAPAIVLFALLTMAMTAAAARRVRENLEPDAVRAFAAVLARLPFVVVPFAPALVLAWVAVFAGTELEALVGALAGAAAAGALGVGGAALAFRRSLYISALFVRGSSARDAAAISDAIVRSSPLAIAFAWAFALLPAGLVLLVAAGAEFDPVMTAVAAFALVLSMPVAAVIMSVIYEHSLLMHAAPGAPARPAKTGGPVAERLNKHVR